MGALEELEREAAAAREARERDESALDDLRKKVSLNKAEETRIEKTIKVYKGEPLTAPKAKAKPQPAYKKYRPTEEVLSDVREAAIRLSSSQPDGKFTVAELIKEAPRSDPAVRNAVGVLHGEERFLRKAGTTKNGNGRGAVDMYAVYPEKMPQSADPEQV